MATCRSFDGTQIVYESLGSGRPALVLVHGWCCNRRYWAAQLEVLSDHALVVTVDLAGHGDSDASRQDWSIAAFGADVCSVIDELALDDVVLVGHSMGADVTLEASRRLVGRVRGMVWVDQFGQLDRFADERQVRDRMLAFRGDFPRAADAFVRRLFPPSADPSLVDRVAHTIGSAPEEVALASLEATWNHGRAVPALLDEVQLPVVAINGPDTHTDAASLRSHGVDVIVIPDVGHFPMVERPREFNSCLLQALARLDVKSGRVA